MERFCVYCGNEAGVVCCGETNGIVMMTEEERNKFGNNELNKKELDKIYSRPVSYDLDKGE